MATSTRSSYGSIAPRPVPRAVLRVDLHRQLALVRTLLDELERTMDDEIGAIGSSQLVEELERLGRGALELSEMIDEAAEPPGG